MSGHAISVPYAGGYETLQYRPISAPTFGANVPLKDHSPFGNSVAADYIVVQTTAIGVNYADVCVRWGLYESAKQYVGWPITPGFEVAGTVVQVGSNVTKCKVGDKVFAVTLFGGYSTHVCCPQHQVFMKPAKLSDNEAAGFPAAALTAWYAVYEMCPHLRAGQKVLVHSAAGGVGLMLCQLLREYGCYVVGVVGSSHKVELVRSVGCHEVIDKSYDTAWWKKPWKYHAVFDANGAETLKRSFNALAPEGRLVCYGFHTMLPRTGGRLSLWHWVKLALSYLQTPRFNPLEMTATNRSVMCFNLSFLFDRGDLLARAMPHLCELIEAGKLRVHVGASFPLKDVAKAHAMIESGKSSGKIILTL